MSKDDKHLTRPASHAEVQAFLRKMAQTPLRKKGERRGRLIFAMDATASREPTWDQACHIQSEMFDATTHLGGLEIQLCYYRGYREFFASPWLNETRALAERMTSVRCLGGMTQIGRVLKHAVDETKQHGVDALVFVGDCMEEPLDPLAHLAGELGLLGVPMFIFHEGGDAVASRAFKQFARLSGGACCPFDLGSARQLRDLLSAVAVYAAGGHQALEDLGSRKGGDILRLMHQVRKG